MTGAAYMNETCTVTNFSMGVTADGGPTVITDSALLAVPCKVLQNASRGGIEQARLLGRSQFIARLPRFMPSTATPITLGITSTITVGSTVYQVKTPPRFFGSLTSPYQEVEIEEKS